MLAIFVKLHRSDFDSSVTKYVWRASLFKCGKAECPFVMIEVRDDLRASMFQHITQNILERSVKFKPQALRSHGMSRLVSWGENPAAEAKVTLVPTFKLVESESTHTFVKIGDVRISDDDVPIIVMYQTDDGPNAGYIEEVIDFREQTHIPTVGWAARTLKDTYCNRPTEDAKPFGNETAVIVSEIVNKIADFMEALPMTGPNK